ncbi:MAG: hypothetical protein Q4F79_11940 [Eubacteriales bacterium]|nr:hypothetical protein [Eubacteriales bacterium]
MAVNAIAATARSDFTHRIADLADEPEMQADELKAYFDSSPQELLDSHNALVSALTATQAAADLGFAPTGRLTATTIQQAIESLQAQIDALSAQI